jgi:hypothetical protein
MTIAEKIIRKCGGHAQVAAWLGLSLTQIYRWTYPREKGGTGGLVPACRQAELLAKARQVGIDLRPDDFFTVAARPAARERC